MGYETGTYTVYVGSDIQQLLRGETVSLLEKWSTDFGSNNALYADIKTNKFYGTDYVYFGKTNGVVTRSLISPFSATDIIAGISFSGTQIITETPFQGNTNGDGQIGTITPMLNTEYFRYEYDNVAGTFSTNGAHYDVDWYNGKVPMHQMSFKSIENSQFRFSFNKNCFGTNGNKKIAEAPSIYFEVTFKKYSPPTSPTGISYPATLSNGQSITISWGASTGFPTGRDGSGSYKIYRLTDANPSWTLIATVPSSQTSIADTVYRSWKRVRYAVVPSATLLGVYFHEQNYEAISQKTVDGISLEGGYATIQPNTYLGANRTKVYLGATATECDTYLGGTLL